MMDMYLSVICGYHVCVICGYQMMDMYVCVIWMSTDTKWCPVVMRVTLCGYYEAPFSFPCRKEFV